MNDISLNKLREKLEELAQGAEQAVEEWAVYGAQLARHTIFYRGKAQAFAEVIELIDAGEFN